MFWLVPVLCACAAFGLALGLVAADHKYFHGVTGPFLYEGPPSGARSLLDSIFTAMITLTGLVFSVTFFALQLVAGQLSPRVVDRFMRDRMIQFTFGSFIATFVYALMVDKTVKGGSSDVPRVAVTVAFLFVFASVALFTLYNAHVAHMMRASTLIAQVARESCKVLKRDYPTDPGQPKDVDRLPASQRVIPARHQGVLISVKERLAKQAAQAGCVVVLRYRMGDFVPEGAALLTVHGEAEDIDRLVSRACKQVTLGIERNMTQDLAFGFRQLIDIIERALPPAANDSTTACEALDALHDLLRRLATRPLAPEAVCGPDGAVRLVIPRYQFTDLLDVTVGEVWHSGSESVQVPDRVARMLADLADVARPEHQAAVKRWISVVNA